MMSEAYRCDFYKNILIGYGFMLKKPLMRKRNGGHPSTQQKFNLISISSSNQSKLLLLIVTCLWCNFSWHWRVGRCKKILNKNIKNIKIKISFPNFTHFDGKIRIFSRFCFEVFIFGWIFLKDASVWCPWNIKWIDQ